MPKPHVKTAAEEVRRRPRQLKMEGIAPAVAPDIEEAAEAFVALRDKRQDLQEREEGAHAELLALMKQHRITEYKYDGKSVTVGTSERVKVRRMDDNGEA